MKLANDGGLLALTSTFMCDGGFIHTRLRALPEAAKKMKRHDAIDALQAIYEDCGTVYEIRESFPRILKKLERAPLDDVRYGAILTTIPRPIPAWAGEIKLPDKKSLDEAISYSEQRLPELINMLQHHSNFSVYYRDIVPNFSLEKTKKTNRNHHQENISNAVSTKSRNESDARHLVLLDTEFIKKYIFRSVDRSDLKNSKDDHSTDKKDA